MWYSSSLSWGAERGEIGEIGDMGEAMGDISGRDWRDWLRDDQGSKRLEVEDMRFRTISSRTASSGGGPLQRGDGSVSLGSFGVVMVNNGVDAFREEVNPCSWVGEVGPDDDRIMGIAADDSFRTRGGGIALVVRP